MIKSMPVQPVMHRLCCDDPKCEGAELRREPVVLTSSPPQYRYNCPVCKMPTTSTLQYPHISYEPIADHVQDQSAT